MARRMAGSRDDAGAKDRTLVITRIFDAPCRAVFKAWTDPKQITRWMAPRGFTIPAAEADLRPGGAWRMTMRPPNGADLRLQGVYREIVEPERLVFTHTWLDDAGKPGHETLVTVTFADHEGKTKMTMRQATFESVAERDGHQGGWSETFDKLAEHLAKS